MVQPTQQYAGEEGNHPLICSSFQKVLVLLLTVGLLATIGAAAVTVSTNVKNPPMSLSHEIVRNRTGGLAVLIHSYSSQDQYRIMQSKDVGGTQWQEVAKTSSNVKPRADIAYNGADDLFVVWRTVSAVNFTAYNWFATQSSTGWALNISAQNVTVTADQDGRAHVAGVYRGDIFYTNCTINPSGSSCVGNRTIATGMYNMSAVAVNGTNHTLVAAQNSTGWIKLVEETATGWTVTPLASNGDNDSISLAVTRQANGQSQPWIVYTDKQDDLWVVNDTGKERQIVTGFVDDPSIATNNGTQLFVTYENTSSNDIQLVKEEGCGWFGPITLQSGTYSNPSTKFEFYNNYNASTILDYIFYEPGQSKVLYSNRTLDQSCTIETQNQFIFVGNVPERGSGVERLSPESITLAQQLARIAAGGRSITASVTVALDDQRTGTVSRLFSQAVAADLSELRTFGAGRVSLQALALASVFDRSQVVGRVLDELFAFDLSAARTLVLDRLVTGQVAVALDDTRTGTVARLLSQGIGTSLQEVRTFGAGRVSLQALALASVFDRSQVVGRVLDELFAFDLSAARTLVLDRLVTGQVAVDQVITVRQTFVKVLEQAVAVDLTLGPRSQVLGRVLDEPFTVVDAVPRSVTLSRARDAGIGLDAVVAVTRLPGRTVGQAVRFDAVVPARAVALGRVSDAVVGVADVLSRSITGGRTVETGLGFDGPVSRTLEALRGVDGSVGLTGAVARTLMLERGAGLGLDVGFGLERSQVVGRVLSTGVGLDTGVGRLLSLGRGVGQGIGVGNVVVRVLSLDRGVDEGLTVLEVVERGFTGGRTVGEDLGLVAAVGRLAGMDRLAVFDVGLDPVASRLFDGGRGVGQGIGVDAGVARLVAGARAFDQFMAVDTSIASFDTMFRGIGTPVGLTGLVGRQGMVDRLRSFGLGYDAAASRLFDGGRGIATLVGVGDGVAPVRLLGRQARLRSDVGLAIARGATLQRVRDTGIEVVLAPLRGVVTARGVADRFGIVPVAGRLFDGFRGAEETVGIATDTAVGRGLLRAVEAPVGYAFIPSRGFTGGRVLDQVYQVTPPVARRLVLSRLPSRNVTVVTEELAYNERVQEGEGTVVTGDVTATYVDDGAVKEIEEDTFVDSMNTTELFRTGLDPAEVTKIRYGANVWREGDAEAIDLYLYRASDGQWGDVASVNTSSMGNNLSVTICETDCTVKQDPAKFINGSGHLRVRFRDTNENNPTTYLNIDYQAVNLSRNVVRHDFGIGFAGLERGRPATDRTLATGIGVTTAAVKTIQFVELFVTDVGIDDAVDRAVIDSRLVDAGVALQEEGERTVLSLRRVERIVGVTSRAMQAVLFDRRFAVDIGIDAVNERSMDVGRLLAGRFDVDGTFGRMAGRSVSLSTSVGAVATLDSAVAYERLVNTTLGFFDWLATLLQEAPSDDTGGGGGGTGGGFGGGGTTEPEPVLVPGLRLVSEPVTLRLRAGEPGSFTVRFRNNGTGNGTYNLDVAAIERFVTPDQASYLLQSNETREAAFQVAVPDNTSSDVYRGGVGISVAGVNRTLPVDVIVPSPDRDQQLQVDLSLDRENVTETGGTLSLDLFNLGNESVQANVTITIYNETGQVVRQETRRMDVQTALSLRERIGGNLSEGRYRMEVAVAYRNRTETASSSFRVMDRGRVEEPADRFEVPWTMVRRAALAVLALAVLGLLVVAVRRLWIRRVEGRETGTYTCDDCGREFSSPELYRIHRNRHRAAGAIMSSMASQEDEADEGSTEREEPSTQSVEVEEEHDCPVCDRSFDSEHGLHVHQGMEDHYLDDG